MTTGAGIGSVVEPVSDAPKPTGYDAFRITSLTDTSPGAANWTYGYDSLDRLISGTSPAITRGWTHDANGNRLTESLYLPKSGSTEKGPVL